MKRDVKVVLGLVFVSILIFSVFAVPLASAGWFSDFLGRITGYATSPRCTDSDGGTDYSTAGHVTYSDNPYGVIEEYDSCISSTYLVEKVCNSQTEYSQNSVGYTCPNGCEAGACKPAPVSSSNVTNTTTPAPATTTPTSTTPTTQNLSSPAVSTNASSSIQTPQNTTSVTISPSDWVFVFTNRGTPMSSEAVNFVCDKVKSSIDSWIVREAAVYNKTKPFTNIICLDGQISLSGSSLEGGTIGTISSPINDANTVVYLESKVPSIKTAKYVTVFHYIPFETIIYHHMYTPKYDFFFIKNSGTNTSSYYPALDASDYGETLSHELMHKLGASDKYGTTFEQACKTNLATGTQYSGYDIMCHRLALSASEGGGFIFPAFNYLKVTEPTAAETGWLATPALIVTSPNGGEQWAKGSAQVITWSSNQNVIGNIIININSDSFNSQLSPSTPSSTGQFVWNIPDTSFIHTGNNYSIQLVGDRLSIQDSSDKPFSIVSSGSSSTSTNIDSGNATPTASTTPTKTTSKSGGFFGWLKRLFTRK